MSEINKIRISQYAAAAILEDISLYSDSEDIFRLLRMGMGGEGFTRKTLLNKLCIKTHLVKMLQHFIERWLMF